MAALESSGTQTASIGTEHTLASTSTLKTRVLIVDTNAMVNGDALELRIKKKVLTGGTIRLNYIAVYANVQDAPITDSVPVVCPFGADFTLKQTAGTGRSYDWAIFTLD